MGLVSNYKEDMNRIVLWGFSLTALILLFACSGSDGSDENGKPNNRKWLFTLDGQSVHAGDTIHIVHTGFSKTISWQDENDPINDEGPITSHYDTYMEIYSGSATLDKSSWCTLSFFSSPTLIKFVLHDYTTEPSKDYEIYVDVQPIDLIGKIDIRGVNRGFYDSEKGKEVEGTFLLLYINEELRKTFITQEKLVQNGTALMHNVARSFFEIKAFGSNKETCYPSYKDMGWFEETKRVGNNGEPNGACFYGKITTNDVKYWFLKFDYGDYSYEVRKYKDSDNCLWNGEWDK